MNIITGLLAAGLTYICFMLTFIWLELTYRGGK